ncbi:conserved hypothetical protein [Frankia canadensis]|uniref:Uncharacterized protein n=1 Tax=Frankia canadensis TaxID=1836972 RepID=A0A2I2KQK9_9ACTN|nr:hypothetical protein [Frankia canadensis]SNQ47916.1 conserved hypothetical protein [Frankia canadensis]SOU55206.1 conserved hypothetical protein [Frankia canadensis]
MTFLDTTRVVRFVQSIHLRRSTIALVVFFLLTVALYLLVRPTPEHVAQARQAARTISSSDDVASGDAADTTPRRTHATPRPTATSAPTATPTTSPDPTGTGTPSVDPSASATATATPTTADGLPGSDRPGSSPDVATPSAAPAPTSGLGLGTGVGATTQP